MPLYVYRCDARHETEYLTRFGTRPPTQCPRCGRKVERIMAPAAIPPDGVYSYEPNIGKHREG